jgi:gas vesicle protein
MSLEELRDLIIVVWGILGIVFLAVALVLGIVLGISARGLIGTVRSLIRDDVQPVLRSARQTVDSIRGTTSFVADTAVAPVIRVYGIVSGVRRFLSVLTGFRKRRSR